MSPPESVAPDDLDALLSDEERIVRQSVARFVQDEALPVIGECFAHQRFPAELVPGMASLGLLGSTLDAYGCAGLNSVCYGLICQGDTGGRLCYIAPARATRMG